MSYSSILNIIGTIALHIISSNTVTLMLSQLIMSIWNYDYDASHYSIEFQTWGPLLRRHVCHAIAVVAAEYDQCMIEYKKARQAYASVSSSTQSAQSEYGNHGIIATTTTHNYYRYTVVSNCNNAIGNTYNTINSRIVLGSPSSTSSCLNRYVDFSTCSCPVDI
ncbi:hypothetical protein CVT24_003744 [Panaeolus cyanescens]|uniref:Uncharacterized protein n=1 Tax=Panaeolus cyanescens TaxID=181874 RepID=A0A409YXK3_9AGAR|nr:hypothetical protein CVT24_003744 [Panaeolus cyanescens]